MLSYKAFASTLSDFETTYRKCLDVLLTLTNGDAKSEDLAGFQPQLYRALLQLSRGFHQIRRERERLIQGKGRLSTTWHDRRQRTLANRQELLKRAILLGRSLGDAFVWFFYRDDAALLREHARQPAPSLPPAGDGGEGELALVDAVRFFGDKYILFHGITTMFRLGDASLVDLAAHRIVGIGELKTTRIDEKRFDLHFQASMDPSVPFRPLGEGPIEIELQPKHRAQLEKQMGRISVAAANARRPPEARVEIAVSEMAYVEELNMLVPKARRGTLAMERFSPGLVVLAYRSGQRTLRSRLGEIKSVPADAFGGLTDLAKAIMLVDSPHNMLVVSNAFYSKNWDPIVLPGATPMLMWHLDLDVKRVIATGEVIVATLFNPAHIFQLLIDQGWSPSRFEPPDDFSFRQDRDGKAVEIGNLEYLTRLVSSSLYREDYVSTLITETLARIDTASLQGTRINLDFSHHVYF